MKTLSILLIILAVAMEQTAYAGVSIDLVGGGTTATYGHPWAYDNDDPGGDDTADDAYYSNGTVLKNQETSPIYTIWGSAPVGDSSAWVVWAFNAPANRQVEGFDFQTQVYCETTVTNSTWTYYYTTETYDGTSDPTPGANGWTQFAQVGYDESGILTIFSNVMFAATDKVYVAFKIDRVVNGGGTADWWDDRQDKDDYVFDLVPQAIDLTAYTNAEGTRANYEHTWGYPNDDPGGDDMADDACYANGAVLKNQPTSPIYTGWAAAPGNVTGDDTAWHVWAFDAPAGKLIERLDFYTKIFCETTVTNSTWTYYYTTEPYDCASNPTPGANGWTQFAQMGYADSDGIVHAFSNVTFAATNRVYVALYIDRVVNGGGTANWWDDRQDGDGIEFYLTSDTSITELSQFSSNVVKMEFICGSPATTYPLKKTDLIAGSWGSVGYSTNGVAPFETNNLLNAVNAGSNLVIYLESTDPAAFFSLGE